jgi:hypothetical protein
MTQLTIQETREYGIGNGFNVLNPEDGYRKDNRLWFGECSKCGERVTNSSLKGIWEHTLYLVKEKNHSVSKSIDYCPMSVA